MNISSPFEKQERAVGWEIRFLERERVTSLYISLRSDRRFSTEQEAKLFYAARATRGHRFYGVPTTPRGRGLLLLVLFFGSEPCELLGIF